MTYTICIKLEEIMLSVENSYIMYELINVSSRKFKQIYNREQIRKEEMVLAVAGFWGRESQLPLRL